MTQQLQKLHDRIPQKCSASTVILALLEICRTTQQNSLKLTALPSQQNNKAVTDKETNTSFENLAQACGTYGRHAISNKCDNHRIIKKKTRSKCCEERSENAEISCSTNSLNFENLQLQCMCSSDHSFTDEDEEQSSQHVETFRERLLNMKQENFQLQKRSCTELVLGNFDHSSVYKNDQSHRISKTFDSCDSIYKPSSKNNHSLLTEADQKSIPYR